MIKEWVFNTDINTGDSAVKQGKGAQTERETTLPRFFFLIRIILWFAPPCSETQESQLVSGSGSGPLRCGLSVSEENPQM